MKQWTASPIRQLAAIQQEIELAICATPTGGRREEITEANILIKQALDLLIKGR
jgi:hypothetical protein